MITKEQVQAQRERYRKPILMGSLAVKVLTEHNLHFGLLDGLQIPGKTVVEIEPEFSFGDGTHPTTKQCLLLLQKYLKPESRVLDVGCGCGILGIAALCLGAGEVFAVDRDARAVATARKNAERNGVARQFTAVCGDLIQDAKGRFSLITANLLAEPLLRLLPLLPELLTGDGCAVLSGIRVQQAQAVEAAAEKYFKIAEKGTEENWVSLVLTRKENV